MSSNRNLLEEKTRAQLGKPELILSADLPLLRIPGWDSVNMIKILLEVEKALSIRFSAAEVTRVKTWGDLVNLVEMKSKK
jgi:acyl carrier protein